MAVDQDTQKPDRRSENAKKYLCPKCGNPHKVFFYKKPNITNPNARPKTIIRRVCRPCDSERLRLQYATDPVKRERARLRHIFKTYNLTPDAFQKMLDGQNGRCAGCDAMLIVGKSTHIDHHHDTGEIRGLLCSPCNTALGMVKENPGILRALAEYLERHTESHPNSVR